MEEINDKKEPTTKASGVPLKRLVSWFNRVIFPELSAGIVFVLFWGACGITAENMHFISSPGYWMAYGFWVGSLGIWWTNKLKDRIFKR